MRVCEVFVLQECFYDAMDVHKIICSTRRTLYYYCYWEERIKETKTSTIRNKKKKNDKNHSGAHHSSVSKRVSKAYFIVCHNNVARGDSISRFLTRSDKCITRIFPRQNAPATRMNALRRVVEIRFFRRNGEKKNFRSNKENKLSPVFGKYLRIIISQRHGDSIGWYFLFSFFSRHRKFFREFVFFFSVRCFSND